MASSQPLDLVTRSLSAIGVVAAGESVESSMANEAFDLLNDMLDQWDNDKMLLFCVQEAILELTGGQYVYTIGAGGDVGATFTGSIAGDTMTVTALASGAISVGQIVTGSGLTNQTAITSLDTALGGNGVNALGTYRVIPSQTAGGPASGSVSSLTISSGGLGFGGVPTAVFAGGGGTGAAAQAAVGFDYTIGPVGGANYVLGDIVFATTGTGTPAKFLVTGVTGGGAINASVVIFPGAYTVVPSSGQLVTGGTGTGATVVFGAGVFLLTALTLTSGGSGYTSTPSCTLAGALIAPVIVVTIATSASTTTLTSYAPRPLRINSAFVRINNSASGFQDYTVVPINMEQYELLGQKSMPGPWPRAVYYQPSMPLGVLNFWPNPSSGEVHLFCDTVLNRFNSLYETIVFPQGYFMALMWCLAEYLIPFYPATGVASEVRALVPKYAERGRNLIKRTNMQPQQTMAVDLAISARGGRNAGWVLNGGFF